MARGSLEKASKIKTAEEEKKFNQQRRKKSSCKLR
jgi:hypothetical protein